MPAEPQQEDVEAKFKDALQDVVEIVSRLSPYCETCEELVDMVKAALKSKGQLRLMVEIIKGR